MIDRDRFNALIERYLNGTLDDDSGAELRDAIESSVELREQLRAQICMDTLLARRFRERNAAVGRRVRAALRDPTQKKGAITRIMEKLPAKSPKKNAPEKPVESTPVRRVVSAQTGRRNFFLIAAAAAAMVALAIGVVMWRRHAAENGEELAWAVPPGAQVVATANPESGTAQVTRNGRTLVLKKSRPLLTGDVLATAESAAVVLSYPDETRVKIPAESKLEIQPAALQAQAGIGIDLARGSIDAEVTPQSKPMIVLMPLGRAEIVGTRFTLASSAAESKLEVLDGKVRLSSATSSESVLVQKGEMAVLSANSKLEAVPLSRDPALWPFSAKSAWNHPLCSGARYMSVESPRFNPDKGVTLAVDEDAIPIYIATANDPERIVYHTVKDKNKTLRIPKSATPERSINKYMNVIDEKHYKVYELKGVQFQSEDDSIHVLQNAYYNSVQENAGVYTNNAPHGTRAYGGSSLGGIIRKGELKGGIRHAIGVSVPVAALNQNSPTGRPYVWPASTAAVLWEQTYGKTGNLHLGSLLAIPPSVDIKKIGIGTSGPAYEIARALQDYGAYIIDHADDAPTDLKIFFEPTVKEEMPRELNGQVALLMRFLQVVTNNTPDTIGGGGKPRRAFAPPFAKEWLVTPGAGTEKSPAK